MTMPNLERFFDISFDAMGIIDAERNICRVNSRFERMTGLSSGALEGMPLLLLVHQSDRAEVSAMLAAVAKGGRGACLPRIMRDDGTHGWYEWRLYSDGEFTFIVARDESEQQIDMQLAAESQELFRRLCAAVPSGIFHYLMPSGKCIDVNAAAAAITGLHADELLRMSIDAVPFFSKTPLLDVIRKTAVKPGSGSGVLQYGEPDPVMYRCVVHSFAKENQQEVLVVVTAEPGQSPEGNKPAASARSPRVSTATPGQNAGAPIHRRILIAESPKAPSGKLRAALRELSATVFEAVSIDQVRVECARGGIDLLMIDVDLPGCDIFEFIGELRETERSSCSHLPVVAMVDDVIRSVSVRCLEAGFDECVARTSSAGRLNAVFSQILSMPE